MRIPNRLRPQSRPPTPGEAAAGPGGRVRLFRLTHVVVVLTNVLQLVMMITFLVLLLLQLNRDVDVSWFAVFSPLWTSDLITTITGIQEMRRLCVPGEARRRNPIINQVNRFKGCICVAIFKLLLALRLNSSPGSIWYNLPIRVVCLPYYFAAVFRFALHFAKEPISAPDGGGTHRTARPGTPVNPVHLMIVVLACRVDGLHPFGKMWAATFWPMWLLFGLLVFASLGAGCLAVGILVTREPRERGQRALFFLCYGILLTITITGITFLLNLVRLLDGNDSISYDAIIGPLIGGYSTLLGFYLAFTLVLPRLMLHDVTIAAIEDEEESEEGGVLDLVSQQLAPPFLVQQSSTLFKRMNAGTMFERYVTGGGEQQQPPQKPSEPATVAVVDLEGDAADDATAIDLEAGEQGADGADGADGAPSSADGSAAVEIGAAEAAEAAAPPALELSEYEALQSEIETWVRAQKLPHAPQPKPRRGGSGKTSAQAGGLGVPPEIKTKLQRFVALKQHLAAAACAEACGVSHACAAAHHCAAAAACTEVGGKGVAAGAPPAAADPSAAAVLPAAASPRGSASASAVAPSGAGAASAPGAAPAAAASKTERGINAAIRAAACGASTACEMTTLSSVIDSLDEDGAEPSSPRPDPEKADASDSLCWICFEGPRDAVLLECGHGGICHACAQRVFRKKSRLCPMCRQPVTQVVHIDSAQQAEPDRNRGVVRVKQMDLPEELR